MKAQLTLQKLLKERLAKAQLANPRYSLRAFSKKVGLHFGTLSSIMNGKRVVSRKIAEKIAERLELDPQARVELLSLFPKTSLTQDEESSEPVNYILLNETQTHAVTAEWEYLAVLSLLQCSEFQSTTSWVASRLNIPESRAQKVIDNLLEYGLIFIDESGSYKRSQEKFRTTDDVPTLQIKKSHEQTMQLARESLYRDSVSERDFSAVTVAIDPKKLDRAKELIRKFEDELCDELEDGTRSEVYRFSVQLFPLTKLGSEVQK